MRARIRDTELFFDIDGAGLAADGAHMRERPTAFLIHGGPGVDHVGLKGRYGRLAERMQLVYFDQRGHGRSARGDPHTYTLDENVEDIEGGVRMTFDSQIEVEGSSRPALVAETMGLAFD